MILFLVTLEIFCLLHNNIYLVISIWKNITELYVYRDYDHLLIDHSMIVDPLENYQYFQRSNSNTDFQTYQATESIL